MYWMTNLCFDSWFHIMENSTCQCFLPTLRVPSRSVNSLGTRQSSAIACACAPCQTGCRKKKVTKTIPLWCHKGLWYLSHVVRDGNPSQVLVLSAFNSSKATLIMHRCLQSSVWVECCNHKARNRFEVIGVSLLFWLWDKNIYASNKFCTPVLTNQFLASYFWLVLFSFLQFRGRITTSRACKSHTMSFTVSFFRPFSS